MNCTKLDLMHIARAMHKSMVKHLVAQKKHGHVVFFWFLDISC